MDLRTGPGLWALMQFKGVGAKRALGVAGHFGTWERFSAAARWEHVQVLGAAAKNLDDGMLAAGPVPPALPEGVRLLCPFDADWPAGLARVPDLPALLWTVGPPPPTTTVAVVGTRQPTEYGKSVARMVAGGAAERGVPTVSGLAMGVDTLAHEACMDAGQPTWAVLGQGVDTLHEGPRAELARRIVDAGGGLLAEVAPGTPTVPHQLTRRNRLQSGLAAAVVVAQSGLPGHGSPAGTMHTARYAVAQGVPLVVARPSGRWADEPRSAGNLALTDPAGCPPETVHATDKTDISRCQARAPYADIVLNGRDDLPALWALLVPAVPPGPPLPSPW